MISFGEWVQIRRKELRLSRPMLAKQVGCAPVTIKKIERDERKPSEQLAYLLAVQLQVQESDLDDFIRRARGDFVPNFADPAVNPLSPLSLITFVQQPEHNLPEPLTSLIGREEEIATISEMILQHRLVTLNGVGGIGKTILCLQIGRSVTHAFTDGVWLIELAPIADPELIPFAVSSVLNLSDSSERTISDALFDFLRSKNCLLILDNCEHLVQPVAEFALSVLQNCAWVKILATSREVLAVPGEHTFFVSPLSTPELDQQSILHNWREYDAIRLFVERAQIVFPDFHITKESEASVIQICRQLDGIPLAIELAAARMNLLAVTEIAERLDYRFQFLKAASRASAPRQQTLEASTDWSWDLLTAPEQQLLRRLAVFAGSMNLEAIESVCCSDGLEKSEVLDNLSALVNKSLVMVQRKQAQDTRYFLLETIRQFAKARLEEAGEDEPFLNRHLTYFQQLVKTAKPLLMKSIQGVWLNRLELELDNIRSALLWAQETNLIAGVTIIHDLNWFCWARGYWHEMDARLSHMIEKSAFMSLDLKALAYWSRGSLSMMMHEYERAYTSLTESLTIYQKLEDDISITPVLRYLGYVLTVRGYFDDGLSLVEESLTRARSGNDEQSISESLILLGELNTGVHNEKSWKYFKESEKLLRQAGDLGRLSWNLGKSGLLAMAEEDYETARYLFEESLELQNALNLRESAYTLIYLGNLHYRLGRYSSAKDIFELVSANKRLVEFHGSGTLAVLGLGYVYLRLGELAQAKELFEKSQRQFKSNGNIAGIVQSLEGLAGVALRQGWAERATELYAFAESMHREMNYPRSSSEQAHLDYDFITLREMLAEDAFQNAWCRGQTMTFDEVIQRGI